MRCYISEVIAHGEYGTFCAQLPRNCFSIHLNAGSNRKRYTMS